MNLSQRSPSNKTLLLPNKGDKKKSSGGHEVAVCFTTFSLVVGSLFLMFSSRSRCLSVFLLTSFLDSCPENAKFSFFGASSVLRVVKCGDTKRKKMGPHSSSQYVARWTVTPHPHPPETRVIVVVSWHSSLLMVPASYDFFFLVLFWDNNSCCPK